MSSKKYSAERNKQSQQSPDDPGKYWNKPIGKITIGVIVGVILLGVGLLVSHLIPPKTFKMPTPGIYMKDVRMENVGTGIKVKGAPPNMVMDNLQMKNVKEKAIDIDTSATNASQRKK
jgi:hypothetical protein